MCVVCGGCTRAPVPVAAAPAIAMVKLHVPKRSGPFTAAMRDARAKFSAAGQAAIRRARPRWWRPCEVCGVPFEQTHSKRLRTCRDPACIYALRVIINRASAARRRHQ